MSTTTRAAVERRVAELERTAPAAAQTHDERRLPGYLHPAWVEFMYGYRPAKGEWSVGVHHEKLEAWLRALADAPDTEAALAALLAWVDAGAPAITRPYYESTTERDRCGYWRFSRRSYLRDVWAHRRWPRGETRYPNDYRTDDVPPDEEILDAIRGDLDADRASGDITRWPWERWRIPGAADRKDTR